MRSTYPQSAFALATVLVLLLLSVAGCKNNPVDAADNTTAGQNALNAATATLTDDIEDELNTTGVKVPFADSEVFFEFNSTDNDLGLQIFLDAEGWEKVRVFDPTNEKIVRFNATGNFAELGITELRLESAEPSPAQVLALFPPGEYKFRGKTVHGDKLVGEGELSHDLLPPPTFTPSDGEEVDPEDAEVEWDAPGAELVEVIIESDESEAVFDVIVEADTESLEIPEEFLEPGTEYKIEILAIAENGNKTITESTFVTEGDDDDE